MIQKVNSNYDTLEKILEQLKDLEGVRCKIQRDRWGDELLDNTPATFVRRKITEFIQYLFLSASF